MYILGRICFCIPVSSNIVASGWIIPRQICRMPWIANSSQNTAWLFLRAFTYFVEYTALSL